MQSFDLQKVAAEPFEDALRRNKALRKDKDTYALFTALKDVFYLACWQTGFRLEMQEKGRFSENKHTSNGHENPAVLDKVFGVSYFGEILRRILPQIEYDDEGSAKSFSNKTLETGPEALKMFFETLLNNDLFKAYGESIATVASALDGKMTLKLKSLMTPAAIADLLDDVQRASLKIQDDVLQSLGDAGRKTEQQHTLQPA